ncbi:PTS sugar transporter subunit IIA [Clostridium sp.]|uniref:PTS sugar transporter subunit IIA n=1 Tax=Clostridium sp. TaxID=1506 RepID=UPI003F32A899
MFNIFKKTQKLNAPISGRVIDLCDVPDDAFAQKMIGDGIAIDTTGDVVVAPCDGVVEFIMDTKHAFAMSTDNGVELLIHVGINTVDLKGEGFEVLVSEKDKVVIGTPILKLDRSIFDANNISLITPLLITNHNELKSLNGLVGSQVTAGEDCVLEYKL